MSFEKLVERITVPRRKVTREFAEAISNGLAREFERRGYPEITSPKDPSDFVFGQWLCPVAFGTEFFDDVEEAEGVIVGAFVERITVDVPGWIDDFKKKKEIVVSPHMTIETTVHMREDVVDSYEIELSFALVAR
jgi:hypothetical protein